MTSSEPLDLQEKPAEPAPTSSGPPVTSDDPLVLLSRTARLVLLYRRQESFDAPISIGIVPGDGPHLPHGGGEACWCQPELFHEDPETKHRVWLHRRIQ